MHRVNFNGRSCYVEGSVARKLGYTNLTQFRERYGSDFTFCQVPMDKRKQMVTWEDCAPQTLYRYAVVIPCDEVDKFLQKARESTAVSAASEFDPIAEEKLKTFTFVNKKWYWLNGLLSLFDCTSAEDFMAKFPQFHYHQPSLMQTFMLGVDAQPKTSNVFVACGDIDPILSSYDGTSQSLINRALALKRTAQQSIVHMREEIVEAEGSDDDESDGMPQLTPYAGSNVNPIVIVDAPSCSKTAASNAKSFEGDFAAKEEFAEQAPASSTMRTVLQSQQQKGVAGPVRTALVNQSYNTISAPSEFLVEMDIAHQNLLICRVCSCLTTSFESLHCHHNHNNHHYSLFQCEYCFGLRQSEADIDSHIVHAHAAERPAKHPLPFKFLCIIEGCNVAFRHGHQIDTHVQHWHKNQLFVCQKCFMVFRLRQGLALHQKMSCKGSTQTVNPSRFGNNGRLTCDTCGENFFEMLAFRSHQLLHEYRPLTCLVCSAKFKYATSYESHMKAHFQESKTNSIPLPASATVDMEDKETKLKRCTHCQKAFATDAKLLEHKIWCVNVRLVCPHCTKICKTNKTMKHHIYTIHSGEKIAWSFYCTACDEEVENREFLNIHIAYHMKAIAESVGKETLVGEDAVNWPLSSSTLYPFPCGLCEAKFKDAAGLERHEQFMHSEHKPPLDVDKKKAISSSESTVPVAAASTSSCAHTACSTSSGFTVKGESVISEAKEELFSEGDETLCAGSCNIDQNLQDVDCSMRLAQLCRHVVDGKEYYWERDLLTAFNFKYVEVLRKLLKDCTFYVLSQKQRQEFADSGVLPRTVARSLVFVLCQDVDEFMAKRCGSESLQLVALHRPSVKDVPVVASVPQALEQPHVDQNLPAEIEQISSIGQSAAQSLAVDTGEPNTINLIDANFGLLEQSDLPDVSMSLLNVKAEPVDEGQNHIADVSVELPATSCAPFASLLVEPAPAAKKPTAADDVFFTAESGPKKNRADVTPLVKEEKLFICRSCPFFVQFPNEEVYLRHMDLAHLKNPTVLRAQGIALPSEPAQNKVPAVSLPTNRIVGLIQKTGNNAKILRLIPVGGNKNAATLNVTATSTAKTATNAVKVELPATADESQSPKRPLDSSEVIDVDAPSSIKSESWIPPSFNGGPAKVKKIPPRDIPLPTAIFTCKMCFVKFNFLEELTTHHNTANHNYLICKHCPAICLTIPDLDEHYSKCHQQCNDTDHRFHCIVDNCGQAFFKGEELYGHICTDHATLPIYCCHACFKVFRIRSSLGIHVAKSCLHIDYEAQAASAADTSSPIPTVDLNAPSTSSAETVQRETIASAASSSDATEFPANAQQQQQQQQQQQVYTCAKCPEVFTFSCAYQQRRHKSRHDRMVMKNDRTYLSCKICSKPFFKLEELLQHRLKDHDIIEETEVFKCKICDEIFVDNEHFKKHMAAHDGLRLFTCVTCDKSFTYALTLRKHQSKPCSKDQYHSICEFCGNKYYTDALMKFHVSTSHARKPCCYCGVKFKNARNFWMHHGTAHPDKLSMPLEKIAPEFFRKLADPDSKEGRRTCQFCLKVLRHTWSLNGHVAKVHTTKPCDYCEKTFNGLADFWAHHRLVHREKMKWPDQCLRTFPHKGRKRKCATEQLVTDSYSSSSSSQSSADDSDEEPLSAQKEKSQRRKKRGHHETKRNEDEDLIDVPEIDSSLSEADPDEPAEGEQVPTEPKRRRSEIHERREDCAELSDVVSLSSSSIPETAESAKMQSQPAPTTNRKRNRLEGKGEDEESSGADESQPVNMEPPLRTRRSGRVRDTLARYKDLSSSSSEEEDGKAELLKSDHSEEPIVSFGEESPG